jgi:hypothetical protein
MASVNWFVEGVEFSNCNCDYACPCQFESLPNNGHCRGVGVLRIDRGHFGNVSLAGLRAAMFFAWPGAIFEGKGELQFVIDERADPQQREALVKILSGEETEPGATHWWVFRAMSDTVHETLFCPIEFDMNMEARTARAVIPGLLESSGRPIHSPVDGNPHRVRIELPGGIEFTVAEIGSASSRSSGAITLDLTDSYGQFNAIRHTGQGIVRA